MVYNLDERATLTSTTGEPTQGRLRDLLALALTWDADRLAAARIETATQEVYGPDAIAEIAEAEGIAAEADEGHPS